jgi:hypothetical protein
VKRQLVPISGFHDIVADEIDQLVNRHSIGTPRIASPENVTQVAPLAVTIRRSLIDCSAEISTRAR